MANSYIWDCSTVDAYPTHTDESGVTESQVVYNVHWRVTGSDGTNESTVIGTQTIDTSDLSTFTEFVNVTHAEMIAWTQAAMGSDRVSEIQDSLDAQLLELATPSSVTLTITETPVEEAPAEETPAE